MQLQQLLTEGHLVSSITPPTAPSPLPRLFKAHRIADLCILLWKISSIYQENEINRRNPHAYNSA